MSAWLSFIGGYAKGANEEIDKQREKEDQYIQDRMKMAAATRLQKQKEAETQRKELEEADKTLAALPGYANAKPEQKIALLASPVIRKQYIDKTSAGEVVNLDDLMTVNAESLKAFPTVESYIKSFQAKPKTADEQTMAAFKQPRQSFGARIGAGEEELKQNAARFGMKPEEALGWEQGGEELPQGNYATLKQSALAPMDIKGRSDIVEAKALRAQDLIKAGDPAGKVLLSEAVAEQAALREVQQLMKPEGEYVAWSKQRDIIRTKLAAASDPKERAALTKQLIQMSQIERIGEVDKSAADKVPTDAALTRGARGAAVTAVQMHAGNKAAKGDLVISTASDGTSEWKYAGSDVALQAELREISNKAMRAFYAQFEGNPAARQNVLLSQETTGLRQADRNQLEKQAAARAKTGGAPFAANPQPTILTPQAKGDSYLTQAVGEAGMPVQPRTSRMGSPAPLAAPKKVVAAPIKQLPADAVLVGTHKGKNVYRRPDGTQFVEE